jgi:hypothetical protein
MKNIKEYDTNRKYAQDEHNNKNIHF